MGPPFTHDKTLWITRCGWPFSSSPHALATVSGTESPKCRRCWRLARRTNTAVSSASSASSSWGARAPQRHKGCLGQSCPTLLSAVIAATTVKKRNGQHSYLVVSVIPHTLIVKVTVTSNAAKCTMKVKFCPGPLALGFSSDSLARQLLYWSQFVPAAVLFGRCRAGRVAANTLPLCHGSG